MIYIKLDGRLGNNLFQIAAGASLAEKLGVAYKAVPLDKEYAGQFKQSIFRKIDFQEIFPENLFVYKEPCFKYRQIPLQSDMIIDGYFQSEKYFDKELVRDLFEIDEDTRAYINHKYRFVLDRSPVSIHVRRGDYLDLQRYYSICQMDYYEKAMKHFPPDTTYLIVSDDIDWCKMNFKGDNFFFSENETPLTDLYLQSFCTHNIIGNSTFAWWGAWLNPNPDKKVIYPSPWFGFYYRNYNTKDLCPPEWVQVTIPGILRRFVSNSFFFIKIHARSVCRRIINYTRMI
ncbi:alpha-1,2-fucosyltransferase [Parabacteroides gordonii]|uniref:alpha-1,2-fucosyltransferase n=1 Tax=Parabacteroides gordonii TaxID=574930 RepID=UPI0026EE81C1|nr:alpha-1,2-fucosyltransferase [Parabacteroides gordonii]